VKDDDELRWLLQKMKKGVEEKREGVGILTLIFSEMNKNSNELFGSLSLK
jgi:hypothetical protein